MVTGVVPFDVEGEQELLKCIKSKQIEQKNLSNISFDFVQKVLDKNIETRADLDLILKHPILNLNSTISKTMILTKE